MTTRQGLSKHKVISSGRLTSSSRGPPVKKKIASKPTPAAEPHYSLYSTDSEDQVTTIHRGLDRCAALLHGILQAENEESKTATSKSSKSAPSKPKPKTFPGRREVERKKTVRKPSCASVSASEQRAISSTRCLGKQQHCYAEEPRCIGDTGLGTQQPGGPLMAPPVATAAPWELMHTQGRPQAYQPQQSGSISQHLAGHQGTTIFNSRLATSTPVLGPQDASPSQPCSSHPMQIHPTQDAALQQFAQHWVIAPAAASVAHGVMATTSTPQMPMAQQPTFRGMPASLLPLIPVATTAPPAAIANMPAPLYSHTAVLTAPPQQPLQPQHGVLSSRQGMPVPPNPTALANGPQMQHSVNPAATGSTGVINPYPVVAPMPQLPSQAMGNQGPSEGCRSGTSSEYSPTSDEEADGVDITPVRDSDCQAGAGSGASTPAILKAKPVSPQKTAKKVMTVKNLLGELKAMVVNQDNAAVQLINEVENSISLLPAMVGSTNIQAELALALQPLRSENVQLRRRLRILNQQLMERERAEREARPVDCDLEMTSLQSLNLTLQLQLREAQKGMEQVQLENNELRQAVEDKENELQLSRQQSEAETSRIRIDVSDALSEMKSYQSKLESSMMENAALSDSLQQREAEICRLQEIIRNLQGKSQGSPTGPLEATPQLRKHVLEIHQQEQKSTCESDDMSDSVKNYLQSMEKNLTSSPSRSARPSPPRTPSSSCAQRRDGGLGVPQENHLRSPRHQSTGILGRETNGVGSEQRLGCGIDFAPLKETALAEPPVRMNQALEGSLTSLSQIMDRMALAARGLKIENTTKPFSNNGTTVHIKANPGVLPIPPPTSKRHLDLGDTPASYTGRPSVMDSSISSSASSESQTTNWSMNSCSTFNTRDEEVFRTGMAALDASIARLQRTLAIDLKR